MAYRFIGIKRSKKKLLGFFCLVLLVVGLGLYWNYKMNYEMIVKFTQLDESDSSFPFGERKIDASPWIRQGYKKIDNYRLYNPNPIPLEKTFNLVSAISSAAEMSKTSFPELHAFFEKKGSFDEFLEKEINIKYIDSTFNEYSNQPNNDYFLVTFDNYEVLVSRRIKENHILLFAYDLTRIASPVV